VKILKKEKSKMFNVIVFLVFILPFITLLLTLYTSYLKYQMKNLSLEINDLRSEFVYATPTTNDYVSDLVLPVMKIISPGSAYKITDMNIYNLTKNSLTTFMEYNNGAVKVFDNEDDAFQEALKAYENNLPYFLFSYNQKFYLYRSDYTSDNNIQKLYTIQIYLFTTSGNANINAIPLRNAGYPAYIYNGKYPTSKEDYYSICIGLFDNLNDLRTYSENIDENNVFDIIGLSIKDRFGKAIYFEGNDE